MLAASQKTSSGHLRTPSAAASLMGKGDGATLVLALLVFAAALAVRMVGIDWHGVHADENPGAAAKVLAGQFSADLQYYPPFLNYCTAALYAGYFVVGKLFGLWTSVLEFRSAFFADRTPFYVLLRFVCASWAALSAPLVYFLALRLRQGRWAAIVAGLATAAVPASVFFSHIGKSDNGIAPAFLLAMLMALRLIERPDDRLRQVALGAALAFGFSVKHSILFLLAPGAVLVLVELMRTGVTGWQLARVSAFTAAAATIVWIPMNVGILLDPVGFLAAQVVQSQMSHRDAPLEQTLSVFLEVVTSEGGIPLAILVAWAAMPLAIVRLKEQSVRFTFWLLWLPTAASIAVVALIAGDRQPIYLWLPQMVLMSVAVVLLLTHAASRAGHSVRVAALAALALFIGMFMVRSEAILAQSSAPPLLREVADEIRRTVAPSEKILSTTSLSAYLDLASAGADFDRARHDRLARKYNVQLPPIAPESLVTKLTGYTVASFPLVIGGLERTDPDEVKVVLPHAWPLQREEWHLDYWLNQGFRVLVVTKESELAAVPAYRPMFAEIRNRCKATATFTSKRPLFNDFDTVIYRC